MAQQYDGKIVIKTAIEDDGLVKGTKEIEASLRRAAAQVTNMSNKQAVAIEKAIQSVSKQNAAYAEQQAKIESLKQQIDELSKTQVATDAFKSLSEEQTKLRVQYDQLKQKRDAFLAGGGDTESERYKKMSMQLKQLAIDFNAVKKEREAMLADGSAYTAADTSDLTAKLSAETQKLNEMGTRLETTYAGVKTNIDSAANSGVKLGSKMKKSFLTILKYGLGIRSVFVLFNKFRNALVTGFKNLAQSDAATNTAINNVKNALTGLKNSLATAFTPILQIVSPILVKFINLLAKAADYVAMFFAALTGKSTYKSAKVVNEVATGMSNTASAAKEAKKQLTGLDEINTWQSNTDSGGAGGGVGEMFEEAPINEKIQKIANKVKELYEKYLKPIIDWVKENFDKILTVVLLIGAALAAWKISSAIVSFFTSVGGQIALLIIGLYLLIDGIKEWIETGELSTETFAKIEAGLLLIGVAISLLTGSWIPLIIAAIAGLVVLVIKYWDEIKAFLAKCWNAIKDTAVSIWNAIKTFFINTWNGIKTSASNIWNAIKTFFVNIWNGLKSSATSIWTAVSSFFTNTWSGIKTSVTSIWSAITTWLGSTWDGIKTKAVTTFTNIKDKITSVFTGLKDNLKGAINGIIGFINRMISGIVSGINTAIRAINKIQVTIPSWIPGIGGKKFGFNIGTITAPQIPLLAKGAVIPPNAPFMAMLGDQKRGNNIETPEKLLRQIVREESGSGGNKYDVKAVVNGRTLFDIIIDEARKRRDTNGSNPFELA